MHSTLLRKQPNIRRLNPNFKSIKFFLSEKAIHRLMRMEHLSKTSVQENFDASNTTTGSSDIDLHNGSNSLYDSAVESAPEYKSFKNTTNSNNNSTLSENNYNFDGYSSSSSSSMNLSLSASDNAAIINDTICSGNSNRSEESTSYSNRSSDESHTKINNNADASALLIQSESTETNASQEDVDPKSQLANKTIFKSDNPNLSIIEISDDKDSTELENSVLVLEQPKDFEKHASSTPSRRSPSTVSSSTSASSSGVSSSNNLSSCTDFSVEKRRRKPESLLQSSKQKLNIDIAEASAKDARKSTTTGADAGAGDESKMVENEVAIENSSSRREIKVYETLEEFERNLPSTVTILDTPFGSKVYLVGTAHFSEDSQDDVSFVIRNVRPDVVMVELCPSRIHMLKLDERTLLDEAKSINLSKVRSIIQTHGYVTGIFFIMLLQMSAQTTKDLGMAPGGEFRRAFEEIQRLPGCMLHLGDRPIRITLIRALRALSFWQTIKLGLRLISSETISMEEVEECKKKDLLEKLMEEMAGEFPAFSDVFVRERDMFLCHSLQVAALPQSNANGLPRPVRVVGIVGIGHAKGIAKMWGCVDPRKIPEIMEIPPASLSTRIGTFTMKYGLIGLAVYGAFKVLRPRLSALF